MLSVDRGTKPASLLGAICAIAISASPAHAQAPASTSEEWTFTLSPYVWFSGLGGEVTLPRGSESFNADFGDIFESLKFSVMGIFEARRENFSLILDLMYLNLQQGVPVPGGGAYSGGSSRVKTTEASAIGLFTLAEQPGGRFELGGGLRAWWLNTEIRLDPGLLPGRTVDQTTNWVDPIIAARASLRLNDRLSLTGYGDIGGFGVGSEFTWQAIATLDWRVSDWISASVGYRWIQIEYDSGRATIDLEMSGPIVGASFRF
jgi:opacity protein-like surface antigen